MIASVHSIIQNIFIGRKEELKLLHDLWRLSTQPQEHLVYVLLNAPGIGKTTLMDYFGNEIEQQGQGIYFKYVCSSIYESDIDINQDLIGSLKNLLESKSNLIENYIIQVFDKKKSESVLNDFLALQKFTADLLLRKSNLSQILRIIKELARIIPVIFVTDKIQEFQQEILKPENSNDGAESGLHYYTKLLKGLLNSNVLLLLSGTRYHILQQIGYKIGSPIKEKVRPIVISKFESIDIKAYAQKIHHEVLQLTLFTPSKTLDQLFNYYYDMLIGFSGGHPRTISIITEVFLNWLSQIEKSDFIKSKYSYTDIIHILLPILDERFSQTLIATSQKQVIEDLTVCSQFGIVKKWIIDKGTQGFALGKSPISSESTINNEEIQHIVYSLLNLGIIIMNGQQDYYITSRFHFLAFLNGFQDSFNIFLRNILYNQYFSLLCGGHGGLGYVFEDIFAAAVILQKNPQIQEFLRRNTVDLNIGAIIKITTVKTKIIQEIGHIEKNILYHTPLMEIIDFLIFQQDTIYLIQLTTAIHPSLKKINEFIDFLGNLPSNNNNLPSKKIKGWYISLFPVPKSNIKDPNVILTSDQDLIPILGKEIFDRLQAIKNDLL
jgi:hypothetical protein